MNEQFFQERYPKEYPGTIDPDKYDSLVELIDRFVKQYADRPAFTCLGHTLSYAELDQLSACLEMIEDGISVETTATLEAALPMFDRAGVPFVPVVLPAQKGAEPQLVGALFHVDALKTYSRALAATAAEEHS